VSLDLDVQVAVAEAMQTQLPSPATIQRWAEAAISHANIAHDALQMTVRIVDEAEIAQLNEQYRQKSGTTNVLSFPFEMPPGMPEPLPETVLGDVVICAAVVAREAEEHHKALEAHWAHMVVHGTLHLLGYDHLSDDEAQEMESLEVAVLGELGFSNPY